MWPTIPEDINSLNIDDLRSLSNALKAALVSAYASGTMSADERETANGFRARHEEIKALFTQKVADKAAADAFAAEDDLETPVEPAAADVAVEPAPTLAADPTPAPAPAPAAEPAPTAVAAVGFGVDSTPSAPAAAVALSPLDYLQATSGSGKTPGAYFQSWGELADACVAKGRTISASTTDRYKLATIQANYPADRVLGEDVLLNAAKFENREELTAAFCAPATPYYNVACMNTVRRPVFNSLPGFAAPRGRVSIMPSPDLADITSGYGQWTTDDDADADARKACITVTCGSPTTYSMYGVWRCMTVKNLLAMTYPELVEAWLNRLQAAHSRLGETLLLDAMGTAADTLSAPNLGYGAATSITSSVLNYLALYQETQRWDLTGPMEAWAHRYVLWGIKMDLMRRRRVDGQPPRVPSDAEVDRMFADAGVTIHWFIDTPTWGAAIPAVGVDGGSLNLLPQSVQILLAPPGKFALIDRGELAIGVTGDGVYRDNDSNASNQFTFFFESFEGLVSTTTCPAHILDIPVCWNGAQIDDIVINCQGGDEVGYQS